MRAGIAVPNKRATNSHYYAGVKVCERCGGNLDRALTVAKSYAVQNAGAAKATETRRQKTSGRGSGVQTATLVAA
jgi:hypothetical protein